MIKIKVKLYAFFKELFGYSEKYLELPDGSSVRDLIDLLCSSGKQRQKIYDDSGSLRYYVYIMLKNGRKMKIEEDLKAKLREGDVVFIFPPLGGG